MKIYNKQAHFGILNWLFFIFLLMFKPEFPASFINLLTDY